MARKAGPGRPKGSPNKATKALKDMILGALDAAGGQEYLLAQAVDNPTAFMTLIGKVLPSEINHAGQEGGPLEIIIRRTNATPSDDALSGD